MHFIKDHLLIFTSNEKRIIDLRHWYLMLTILPALLYIILFSAVYHITNEQIAAQAELSAERFHTESVSALHEMQILSSALMRDTSFIESLSAKSASEVDSYTMTKIIKNSIHASASINHVYVISAFYDQIYADTGYYSLDSLPALLAANGISNTDAIYDNFTETQWHILNGSGSSPYCVVPVFSSDGTRLATMVISLKLTTFLQHFFHTDADLCCIFNDDFYLCSLYTEQPPKNFNWHSEKAVSDLLGRKAFCFYIEDDANTYMIAIARQRYAKPLYVIAVSFLAYFSLILMVECFSFAKINASRRKNINALIDVLPHSYSGDKSYEAIIPEVIQSLKSFRDQNSTSEQKEQLNIRDRNLRYILYGHDPRIISDDFLYSAGIERPFQREYTVVSCFIDRLPESFPSQGSRSDDYEYIRVVLLSVVDSLCEGHFRSTSCSDMRTITFVLWKENPNVVLSQLSTIFTDAVRILSETYAVTIRSVISAPVHSIAALSTAFRNAISIHNFADTIGSSISVITETGLKADTEEAGSDEYLRHEQILLNTVLSHKYDNVPEIVDSILTNYIIPLKRKYSVAHARQKAIANILAETVAACNHKELPLETAAKKLRDAPTVEALSQETLQTFTLLSKYETDYSSTDAVINRACQYIEENLSNNNLSVALISEATGISFQRLTRHFQMQFHTGVAEYVNMLRIEKSKQLLRNPRISIYQIAKDVGYNNTATLTRNFRKIEGLTPTEYRELKM